MSETMALEDTSKDFSKSEAIRSRVHELYWHDDINCARTTLICLGELFEVPIDAQTVVSAIGLHGAGGYRAQCGLVEGALMFIAIYLNSHGMSEERIVSACNSFASEFEKRFGSLRCYDLRPNGFREADPPHLCESLTVDAIEFASDFLTTYNQ